jgi:hypothetical protein
MHGCEQVSSGQNMDPAGSCEHKIEILGSIENGKFWTTSANVYLLKKVSLCSIKLIICVISIKHI